MSERPFRATVTGHSETSEGLILHTPGEPETDLCGWLWAKPDEPIGRVRAMLSEEQRHKLGLIERN